MSQFYVELGGPGPGGVVEVLTGNSGGPVGPDGAHNINIIGSGAVTVTGNPGTHTLTIAVAGVGIWTDKAVSFAAAVNNGYFCTAALTATLPAAPTQGQTIDLAVDTAGTVIVQANAGQTIRIGNSVSTVAGTATNSDQGDALSLVYRASDSLWFSINSTGNWFLA